MHKSLLVLGFELFYIPLTTFCTYICISKTKLVYYRTSLFVKLTKLNHTS